MVTNLLKLGFPFKSSSNSHHNGIEIGTSYIVKEERPHLSYKVFSELARKNDKGLIISRVHPHRVAKQYGISSEILWLSTIDAKGSIEPTQLSKLAFIINHYVKTNKGCPILIDGLEYLILQNGFETVLKFIYSIADYISIHKGVLLLPLSPNTLSTSQVKMLERELEPY